MGWNRALVVVLLVLGLAVALPVGPALGQTEGSHTGEAGDTDSGDEGGIEGMVAGFIDGQGLLGAALVLFAGMVLLTACVEKLISYLTRAAFGLQLSLFALAILFTGFEFDDTVLALVLSAGKFESAALGTALGTGLSIVGVTLALAAIVHPFSVDLPTDYVVLFAVAPLLLVPFVLEGTLTTVHGLLLLGSFVLMFGYILAREYQRDIPVFRSTELGEMVRPDGGVTLPPSISDIPEDRYIRGRSGAGWVWLGLGVLALGGIVFASVLLEAGSQFVVEGFGIGETVFGATILTAILTFEDIMLTIEPVRRGIPEIGVGNVIGSVLFSLTGNVGVIMLVSDLTISRAVLTFHLPAIVVVTALAAYFFAQGRLNRRHGVFLGSLYIAYWGIALFVLGGVPVGG
jgi:cation:H+ antiporter